MGLVVSGVQEGRSCEEAMEVEDEVEADSVVNIIIQVKNDESSEEVVPQEVAHVEAEVVEVPILEEECILQGESEAAKSQDKEEITDVPNGTALPPTQTLETVQKND